MSEVAGRMAIQQGAKYLEMAQGGHGVLLGGVPGVEPGTVVVIGGGVVGVNAAKMACGYGRQGVPAGHEPGPAALSERRHAGQLLHPDVQPGDDPPKLVRGSRRGGGRGADSRRQGAAPGDPGYAGNHEKGQSVLVDVAIDQGGCFETSKATTHGNPTYVVDGVVHYCVANMPGAVAKTSTLALTNATLPYAVEIANKGWKRAMQENNDIKLGANVINGHVTYRAVAEAFDLEYVPVDSLL
jgi:alanine dehydrogenase